MPSALSTTERGAKQTRRAQPAGDSGGASSSAANADVQRMPAYAEAHAPSLSLLGGAVQRRPAPTPPPADERREDENATPRDAAPVQRQTEDEETADQRPSQDEETDVQTKSASGGGGATSSTGGASSAAHASSNGNGHAASNNNGAPSSSSSNADGGNDSRVQATASRGLGGATRALPDAERIQESFGRHDVSDVRVEVGGPAERANERLGATAYTSGNRIAFKEQPDLKLAAHEAAHVVQQRRGVHLKGGVGEEGDPYEQQADRAADAVVAGESAEDILSDEPRGERENGGVQMKCDCGGGCASCGGEQKKQEVAVEAPVQMQLEVTTERKGVDELAAGGGGAAATEKAAGEEEQKGEEEDAAEESEEAAAETKGEAEATSEEQAEAVAQSPAKAKEEEAKEKASEPETTGERGAEAQKEREEEKKEEEKQEETSAVGEPQSSTTETTSTTSEEPEPATQTGEMQIQRKRCDPPPPPPEKKPKEGDAPPPDPPPGKVDEQMKSEGPTAEEESKACGAEQMADSLESAAPAEQAAAAGEQVSATEPAASEGKGGEGAATTGAPEGKAAKGGGGGGGGAGGGGEAAQAASEGMNANISQAEAGRSEAVSSYEASSSALEETAGGASNLASENVSFPKAENASEADEKRRADATDAVRGFLSGGSERISDAVKYAQEVVPERAGDAAKSAKSAVDSAASSSAAALAARIAQARADANAQHAVTHSQINAGHDTAVSAIETETTNAINDLDAEYILATEAIPFIESDQITALAEAYAEGDRKYKEVGKRIGEAATERGEYYAKHYDGCHIHKKDSFWDGYLTDRRAKARKKASRDVAKGYKESLEKEADKQAKEGMKGFDCDQQAVHKSAAAALDSIDASYQSAVATLVSAQTQAIASAGTTRDDLLAAADRALEDTLSALTEQEQSQLKTIEDTRYLQIVAVEQSAHMAAAAMQSNILAAASALMGAIGAIVSTVTGSVAPHPKALSGALAKGTAKMDAGLGDLYGKIDGGLSTVEGQIADHGTQSSEAVNTIGTDGIAQVDQAMTEYTMGLLSLEQSAADTFGQLTESHTTQTQQTASAASIGIQEQVTGLKTTYETLNSGVAGRFNEATTGLEAGLRDSLKGMDSGKDSIPKYADEAASKEAPAWKSVVKWVLIIAIIVVVALVIGPAVIGAVGAWAGSAVAGAVIGGAIVGAATGAAIQMLNNWETNTALMEGVGKAAVMGAIGGAIGGAGGLLIGRGVDALGKVAISALSKKAIEVGANLAFDAVQEIGTQLVTTGTVDWGEFGTSMVMSFATAGMGEIPKVKKIQGAFSARGEALGAKLPGAPKPKVSAPDVKTGGATPTKTETAAPETTAPKPAAPEPEAAAPKAAAEPEAIAPTRPAEAAPETKPTRADAEPETAGAAPKPSEADSKPPAETAPTKPAAEVEAETKAVAEAAADKPKPGAGDAPRLEATPDVPAKQRTNEELGDAAASTKVGDEQHGVVPRNWMGEIKLFACSPSCAPLTDKIKALKESKATTPELKARLEALELQIKTLEAKIKNGEVSSTDIVKETGRVAEELNAIGKTSKELGDLLNAPVGGQRDADIRAEEAPMWAVDPETGKFDKNGKLDGLSPDDVDALARLPAQPGESHAVYRRRRYLADKAAEVPPGDPMKMDAWCEWGFRANVNRDVSSPMETAALGATGATPNNAAGQRKEHTTTEHIDDRGRPVPAGDPRAKKTRTETTRPDGTRPNKRGGEDVIEHKHLTGNEDTLDDSHQLRAQREMAGKLNGDHELVISSDRPLKDGKPQVEPSKPLGASDSRIYYYDPTTGRVTHQWVQPGTWRKIKPNEAPPPATNTGATPTVPSGESGGKTE